MHEAGAVARALDEVISEWPDTGTRDDLELEIRDATRAEAGAVAFYASAILADSGLDDVRVSVRTCAVSCQLCGAPASPTPADPQCHVCGAPLPRIEGPAVVCHQIAARPS